MALTRTERVEPDARALTIEGPTRSMFVHPLQHPTISNMILNPGDTCDYCGRPARAVLPLLVPHPDQRKYAGLEEKVDVPACAACWAQRQPRTRVRLAKDEALRLIEQYATDVEDFERPIAELTLAAPRA